MKMRTIPDVNNPPFRPGVASVGFLKICRSLEKMYMNPTLKIPNKISTTHHGHVRRGPYVLVLYKTSMFFAHLLLVMLLRRSAVIRRILLLEPVL